jgi:hypothetical protein
MHGIPMVALGIRSKFPTTAWPVGNVVVQEVDIDLPPDFPPLSYKLVAQIKHKGQNAPVPIDGELSGALDRVSVSRPTCPHSPGNITVQRRRQISFDGKIRLFGYSLPKASPRPGHHLPIWLNWIADADPKVDYEVQLRLLDRDGTVLAETKGAPATTTFPTSKWKAGDLAQGTLNIPLPAEIKGGQYRLALRLVNEETRTPLPGRRAWGLRSQEWIAIGRAEVAPWPLITALPKMEYESNGVFGNAVRLLGYDLSSTTFAEKKQKVTLYWQVEAPLKKSFLVFVHLCNESGDLVAQADGIPANWLRPTTTWREGEIISDSHTLTLPSDLPEGTYQLYVGFYEPEGQRLPVVVKEETIPDRRLSLGSFSIAKKPQ